MQHPDLGDSRQLDPVLDFLRLLWRIEHGLQRASKRMESTIGLTGPQRLVLRIVGRFPNLSAGELAHIIQLHPSTVTGILHRLSSRHLVVRQKDPADSRRIKLRLQTRAEKLARVSSGTVERAVAETLAQVEPARVSAAREVLSTFAAALHEVNEASATPAVASRRKPRRARPARH